MEKFNFKKKFGQNFLVDSNIVKKIVSEIDIKDNSLVIEIGCGDGRLTKELCSYFDFVLGYEIDTEVKDLLISRLDGYDNYEICFDDFLKRDFVKDLGKFSYKNIYVVANLPYYITTPIVEKLIDSGINFCEMSFMVQKEVGDRFSAKEGSRDYNSLSIYLNYKYDVSKAFYVSRNSFIPRPNVDSVVVRFKKKKNEYNVLNEDFFYKLVRDSFRFKRKTIRNNLVGYDLDIVSKVLEDNGFSLGSRAEEIPIGVFCEIANKLVERK